MKHLFLAWLSVPCLLACIAGCLLSAATAGEPKKVQKLPQRAISRLGTHDLSHSGEIRAAAYLNDERSLVTGHGSNVYVWDRRNNSLVDRVDLAKLFTGDELGHVDLTHLAPCPKSDTAVIGCTDLGFFIWDVAGRKKIHVEKIDAIGAFAISDNGRWICVLNDKNVLLFDTESRKQTGTAFRPGPDVSKLAVSRDGTRIAAVLPSGFSWKISVWDAMTGKELIILRERKGFNELVFSNDSKTIFFNNDERVCQWQYTVLKMPPVFRSEPKDGLGSLALSPDGATLAVGDSGGLIELWDTAKWTKAGELHGGHFKAITALAFSADGKALLSGSEDRTANQWETKTRKLLTPRNGHRGEVTSVIFSPDNKTVLTGGEDGRLLTWKATGQFEAELHRERDSRWKSTRLVRSGTVLVTTFEDKEIHVRSLPDLKLVRKIPRKDSPIDALTLSPDGKTMAIVSRKIGLGTTKWFVRLVNVSNGDTTNTIDLPFEPVTSIAFAPDRDEVLVLGWSKKKVNVPLGGDYDDCFIFLDLRRGKPRLEGKISGVVPGLQHITGFSSSGKAFLGVNNAMRVTLMDTETGKPIRNIGNKLSGFAQTLAIAPRSNVVALAFGHEDPVIELWDLTTNRQLHTLEGGHRASIQSMAFSDNEAFLVTGSADTTAMVWDVSGILK